jgi:integrase
MATIQTRNGSHRLLFQYSGRQHALTIGKVPEAEARQWKSRVEALLMRVKQNLLEVPRGCPITDFLLHDGKPPADPELAQARDTTLRQLRDAYLATVGNGSVEANTLYTAGIHLDHVEQTFGGGFPLAGMTLGKLQGHVTRRAKDVAPTTIKKELDTFRSAWRWGQRMKLVDMPYPSAGLVYPKTDEKPPFMTWAEVERRVKQGGDAGELWECLYLDTDQIAELLGFARAKKAAAWVYAMVATAAHTGARRSELMRMRVEDVDLSQGVLTIREKKRARGTRTTRRVPISPTLAEAMAGQIDRQDGRPYLFGDGVKPQSVQTAHKAFLRLVKGSKWDVLHGWHTLRHSFISALANKGVDQRIIDDFCGHSTEQQRRRYRHLFPHVTKAALASVFG